jgi:TPR repeat protein
MMLPDSNPSPVLEALEREDYQSALRIALPYANAGNPVAQATIALLYKSGLGVEQDVLEAERWLLKAAAQNDPVAWNNLGTLYAAKHAELRIAGAMHSSAARRPKN